MPIACGVLCGTLLLGILWGYIAAYSRLLRLHRDPSRNGEETLVATCRRLAIDPGVERFCNSTLASNLLKPRGFRIIGSDLLEAVYLRSRKDLFEDIEMFYGDQSRQITEDMSVEFVSNVQTAGEMAIWIDAKLKSKRDA
jgi:hypothetical protein